jgi:hypothetical protein
VSGIVFMFSAPEPISGKIEDAESNFLVSRSRTRFRRYRGRPVPFSCFALSNWFSAVRGRRVPFSCFALPNMFWVVPRVSGPVLMFFYPELVLGGTGGVRSRFHILRSRTHFGRYRGRQIPFSCFALTDTFSTKSRASGPIFMFCATEPVFDGTKGVRSRFHVLRPQTHFRR